MPRTLVSSSSVSSTPVLCGSSLPAAAARRRTWRPRVTAAAWLWLAACSGGDDAHGPQLPSGVLDLTRVDWSQPLPSMSGPGHVATVAESGDEVALYSDLGIFLWSSGSTAGSDVSIRAWRAAAAVPALGIQGAWLLGVDGDGRLHRLRNGTSFGLEDVTDRYALSGAPVREVVPTGTGSEVVFALENQVALTDGVTLKRFDLTLRNLTAMAGRVAGFDDTGLRTWTPQTGSVRHIEQPGLVGIAFGPEGRLWVAAPGTLYWETDGSLQPAHHVEDGLQIAGIAGSRRGLWLSVSDGSSLSLALLRDGSLLRPASSPAIPLGSRLLGSTSGDVWVLSPDGQLSRYGEERGGGRDLVLWRETLQPLFGRHCQGCHLPNGSAHIDMTSYGSWNALRQEVMQRVVLKTPSPMPPAGSGTLTAEELASVQTWAARSP